jgi:hypothetical protein
MLPIEMVLLLYSRRMGTRGLCIRHIVSLGILRFYARSVSLVIIVKVVAVISV